MSIKVMSNVWEQSQQEGPRLLLLLALADHASDDGVCWPGIERLSTKTRKGRRQVQRLLRDLETSGELYTGLAVGRGNTNLYLITIGRTETEIKTTLVKRFSLPQDEAARAAAAITALKKGDSNDTFSDEKKATSRAVKGDIQEQKATPGAIKGDIAMSPESLESSCKHQKNRHPDPSGSALLDQFLGPAAPRQPTEPTGGNYAIPVQAGGDHSPAFAIVDGICRYNGLTQGANSLPAKKRTQWIRHIAEITETWGGATTVQARLAWQAWTIDYAWKEQINPFYKSFETEIGPLLIGVREGSITIETLRAKTNDTNRKRNGGDGSIMAKPLAVDVDTETRTRQRNALAELRKRQQRRRQIPTMNDMPDPPMVDILLLPPN